MWCVCDITMCVCSVFVILVYDNTVCVCGVFVVLMISLFVYVVCL